jgi:hypothetical protein
MLEYPALGYTTAPHYFFTCSDEVLEAAAMYIPQEAMVYLVVHQTPTREMVRDLAERMGVTISDERYGIMPEFAPRGGEYSATVGVMSPDSLGDLDVTLSDDGNYMLNLRSEQPGSNDPDAPTDERAVAVAEDFVKRSGLLPKGSRFERVGLGEAVTENLPGGGDRQKPLGTMVIYTRDLGGIPDGSFAIRINGREQVYSVSRNALNLTPFRAYPLLTPAEAVEALRVGDGSLSGPWAPPGLWEAVVDSIDLRYNSGAPGWEMGTIQPVFSISGITPRSRDRWSAMVPAVRREYLKRLDLGHGGGGHAGGGAGPRAPR